MKVIDSFTFTNILTDRFCIIQDCRDNQHWTLAVHHSVANQFLPPLPIASDVLWASFDFQVAQHSGACFLQSHWIRNNGCTVFFHLKQTLFLHETAAKCEAKPPCALSWSCFYKPTHKDWSTMQKSLLNAFLVPGGIGPKVDTLSI